MDFLAKKGDFYLNELKDKKSHPVYDSKKKDG